MAVMPGVGAGLEATQQELELVFPYGMPMFQSVVLLTLHLSMPVPEYEL